MIDHSTNSQSDPLTQFTVDIVTAYVAQNKLSADSLSSLISSVHRSLQTVSNPQPEEPEAVARPTAAQIRRSVTDEHLISFEDYPMVAPAYSARRSALAKEIGLGQKTGRKKRAR